MSDSFQLIHSDLAEEAEWGLDALYSAWSKQGRIEPFLILWPSRTVMFEGQEVNDAIPMSLPENTQERGDFITKAVKNTAAWALMLCEQRDQAVVVVFESPIGTKSWHLPIRRIAGVDSLGDPVPYENTDYVGVLNRSPTNSETAASRAAHL